MFLKLKHKRKNLTLTGDMASVDRFNALLTARNTNKSLVATVEYSHPVDITIVSHIRIIDPKEWDISLTHKRCWGDGIITTLTSSL